MSQDFYDKADWHYTEDFPNELDENQIYVHGGIFLAWAINHDLASKILIEHSDGKVEQVKQREITGSTLISWWDGVLASNMFSDAGNAFAEWYFNNNNANYFSDYETHLSNKLPSMYHVEDSWKNYDKISIVIDNRYIEWLAENN